MPSHTRRCMDCKSDISNRGQKAKRCKACVASVKQQKSIEHQERRAELKALSGGTVTRAHITSLRKKQDGKCARCGLRFWGHAARQETLDHDIPLIRGGVHDDSNIVRLLCRGCNSSKGSKSFAQFAQWEKESQRRKPVLQPSQSVKEQRTLSHLTVRLQHPDHVANIRAAASREGLSTNAWIVNILVDASGRILNRHRPDRQAMAGDCPPPVGYDDGDQDEVHHEAQWDWETGPL